MKQKLLSGFNLRAILAFFFLSYIPITYAQYCNSTFSNVTYEFLTNVTFAGINNTTTGATGAPGNYTAQVANVAAGSSYTLSVTIDPDGSDYVMAYIDWNQNSVLNDAGEIYTVATNTSSAGPHTLSIAVPPGATAGNTRMRVICQFNSTSTDPCLTLTYGEAEDYTVNVSTGACSGTPTPGNTTASSPTVCPSANFTLGLQNNTLGTGVTYQWQSSADGVTYTNVAGATNSTLTISQTAATYYQAIVTCGAGTPSTSTPLQVPMNSFLNCYCTSSALYIYDEDILNVTLGSLNNTSNCGTAAAGAGSVLNQYSNFTGVTAPSLARTATYSFAMSIGSCSYSYSNVSKAYIDFNQNGIFTDAGEMVYASTTPGTGAHTESAMITIPVGAMLGTTRMRVITMQTYSSTNDITPCGTYGYGETEDYYVTIAPVPTCPQPTNFVWLEGTTSSADLSWTPGGSETAWEVEYGAPGFTPGTGTIVNVTTGGPQTTISGLPANTFYTAYVRAVCSVSDESFNAGPISFNTYGLGQYMEANEACGTGFIDISENATATNLNMTDDSEFGLTLPFPIFFQGTIVTDATIGNNGGIKLNTTTANVAYTMDAPGLYPYNQDMGTATDGGVYMEVLGTTPNRKLVVQWNNVPHYTYPPATDGATFEVVFDEATSEIYYHYADVNMSNPSWDFGADAEIGVRGPQNIDISINNSNYLMDNECVHLYYTDCPKPKNLVFSNITADEFSMDWAAGPSNEGEWIVEYGPAGFTPGTGTELTDITSSDQQIPGLTPITTYDVYIYAACANGDTSFALMGSVQTLPLCSDPYALYATATDADSIQASWQWTETVLPLQGFNLQYGVTGFEMYGPNATIIEADGMNFADTIVDTDLMAGVTYQVYVQAVCPAASGTGTDTSNFVGPFSITMPLTNDTVCYAEHLMTDGTVYTFTNNGATVNNTVVANQEQTIAPPNTGLQTTTGWGNSTISNSTWFTFTAPASGQVRISGKNVGYDGQMAVYQVGNCAQFSTFTLKAANDNEIGGSSLAPNFTVCGLTPGSTYYLMHDPYSTGGGTGTYSIKINAISLQAGSTGSLLEVCTGDSVNLFDGISGNDNGGVWSPVIPSIVLAQDSIFASNGLAYQTFQFQYRMTDGCAYDSILASVKIFPPSHAGTDGSLVVCRNEPFNLLEGLGGNVDLGGTWYNPTSAVVPAGNTIADNFPGQYNYKYIVGNGVCPNDTAKVIVSVGTCNYLGLDEAAFEGFSLYPNPTDGYVYVTNGGSSEVFNYEVLDLNGRKVMTKENAINGTTVTEIDLNAVETGIYMIHVYNGNAEKTFRVVVK